MKIQFGCGGNHLPGFVNYDSEVDITKPLPVSGESVDFVFIEHVLEHVSAPDCLRFMDEVRRILKPGGKLRICVPVLARLEKDHARDIVLGHGHMVVFNLQNMIDLLHLAGFSLVSEVVFDPTIDSHWKVIGERKDNLETLRVEATK